MDGDNRDQFDAWAKTAEPAILFVSTSSVEGRAVDLHRIHRIHREIADLYPRLKQIENTLGRGRRRNEPYSPDFADAARLEKELNKLMSECADASSTMTQLGATRTGSRN
jgi:hypothetical protein